MCAGKRKVKRATHALANRDAVGPKCVIQVLVLAGFVAVAEFEEDIA